MTYFKKIFRFALPYKRFAYLNIFFNILFAFFGTLAFISLIPMLKVLFGQEEKVFVKPVYEGLMQIKPFAENYMNYFITTTNAQYGVEITLLILVSLVIGLFLLKNMCSYFAMYFITFLRNGVLRDIRNSMYKKVVDLPVAYFSEKRKGDVMARMSSDVLEIQHSFLSILELIVREPLTILFTVFAMFVMSVKLTLFVFIFIPISGIIISQIGKSLKKKSDLAQKEQGYFLSIIDETLTGLKVIKGFNAENYFNDKFRSSTGRFFRISNKILHKQNLSGPTTEFLGILVIAVLLWYGGNLVLVEQSFDGAVFIPYMGLAYNILTPAKQISKASYSVKKGNAAAERVLEILEEVNPIASSSGSIEKCDFEKAIVFDKVNFKYEEDWVLKDFSLEIPKGKTVALVGQSGSGKSTLANLLLRFYDVNNGRIAIDGIDLRDMHLKCLRGLMGLVTQDSILFNDTVKANVALGLTDVSDEAVIDALKVANAYEFVKNLPKGIYTNIGDSGNKLSGGQKQRLSIARAVLKNPPIMVLDEATSALDTESEQLVQQALENMMQNRTSVVIAHRLSTIQNADLIVVLSKGKIVEKGTHESLLAEKGIYEKLVNMQRLES
ncbi:MAG: ATP-binding cassette domain-containing protein [Bacteroidetes bacterium]|nr:ATP-binding cassette domain-containing protein [Bacteroidota bacterium]